ncbi:MAG: hypothetical protein J4F48_07720 [Nitrospinae bacterium]|nr:hypothetical protein [Nitrospinota bacterium]
MSDIGSTPMTKDPSKSDESKVKFLSTREVVMLGVTGGILVDLVAHPGLLKLDFSDPKEILGSILIGAVLGGIWAFVNMPEYDRKRALQFGMIAPAVFVSFTYAKDDIEKQQEKSKKEMSIEQTQKQEEKKKPTELIQKEKTGSRFTIFENAYAATQPFLQEDLHAVIETASKKKKRKRPWWIRIFR